MRLPEWVVQADWCVSPQKRWLVRARLVNGRYHIHAPELVGDTVSMLVRLATATALIGFDFPIGLPRQYAQQVGVTKFLHVLPQLGRGQWAQFYAVADVPERAGLYRPFYPQRPGRTRQQHLLDALNVTQMDDLRRVCDLAQPNRSAAAPLFWTMGPQQVGKAAITGWRDVLAPALRDPALDAAIWPFSGKLVDLLRDGRLVMAEAYPAEYYAHLGLGRGWSKRKQADRVRLAEQLLAWVGDTAVTLQPELQEMIVAGFGPLPTGEDQFDAFVGVAGLLNVVMGQRPLYEPASPVIRHVEGWIMGQDG
jgi:hypothetical protein